MVLSGSQASSSGIRGHARDDVEQLSQIRDIILAPEFDSMDAEFEPLMTKVQSLGEPGRFQGQDGRTRATGARRLCSVIPKFERSGGQLRIPDCDPCESLSVVVE